MANRENKLNEATSSPQDGTAVRDDMVHRLSRLADAAKMPRLLAKLRRRTSGS